MAISLDSGRQEVIAMRKEVLYSDLTNDDGTSEALFDIPYGAEVVGGGITVNTVFDSTTSDVLDIGDGVDDDEYTSSQIDLTSAGYTALTVTGYQYTAADTIDVEWTAGSTGTATAGKFTVTVLYVVEGRSGFSYANQSSSF